VNDGVRVDKWLWAARFFKTRNLAREAVKGGKVQLNGTRLKPGKTLGIGSRLEIRKGEDVFNITVTDLGDRRVSATLAKDKYTEDPDSLARREARAQARRDERENSAQRLRRPDKRQRRRIVQFKRVD
jgi:ribosome-associated heat shock protein Hsp15